MTWMTSDGHEVDVWRAVPDYKYVPESEFLTGQASWDLVWMSGILPSNGALDNEVYCVIWMWTPLPSHPPEIIHVISVPRPSLFFAALLYSCIIMNANWTTKPHPSLHLFTIEWKSRDEALYIYLHVYILSCWCTFSHAIPTSLFIFLSCFCTFFGNVLNYVVKSTLLQPQLYILKQYWQFRNCPGKCKHASTYR